MRTDPPPGVGTSAVQMGSSAPAGVHHPALPADVDRSAHHGRVRPGLDGQHDRLGGVALQQPQVLPVRREVAHPHHPAALHPVLADRVRPPPGRHRGDPQRERHPQLAQRGRGVHHREPGRVDGRAARREGARPGHPGQHQHHADQHGHRDDHVPHGHRRPRRLDQWRLEQGRLGRGRRRLGPAPAVGPGPQPGGWPGPGRGSPLHRGSAVRRSARRGPSRTWPVHSIGTVGRVRLGGSRAVRAAENAGPRAADRAGRNPR